MIAVSGAENTFGCLNNTIRLRSGGWFDFQNPQPSQFTLEDIAGALSKICRFGGQIDSFYSVAEHSVHCAMQAMKDGLPLRAQIALLLHDATEAFCGDVVKPLKIMLPEYADIERRVENAIAAKFSIDFSKEREAIHAIDWAMLIAEKNHLFSEQNEEWVGERDVRALDVSLYCWGPAEAESQFLQLANQIGAEGVAS